MKGKVIIIICIIVLLLIGVILFLIFNPFKKKNIVIKDITSFHLSYSNGYAMYAYINYDLKKENDKITITVKPYGVADEEAKDIEVEKDFLLELEEILNKYNVGSWNGFDKTDKYVLDGDSFSLSIWVGEENISAHGYMMWPNNYRDVRSEIDSLFMKKYEES